MDRIGISFLVISVGLVVSCTGISVEEDLTITHKEKTALDKVKIGFYIVRLPINSSIE